ncbi:MAG: SEC-C metal-binding domain-containing protein, partial [Planctomycetia bacterium]
FRKEGIAHEVLNAKFVEREADIVAQAGRKNVVTIATNMAGRGTDIILGGNPDFKAWADLKDHYPTRLEVPPEAWREAVGRYEPEMKKEGREVATPVPTLKFAEELKFDDPAKAAQQADAARDSDYEDCYAHAKKIGVAADRQDAFVELMLLRRAANPGGLHIVGTERHDSRRIDNQLRGRAGRQGDPGSARFFVSLEDDLMRIFAGEMVKAILQRMGMVDGQAIESPMVSRRIQAAQKRREEYHFEVRKHLLEYDEIMDVQRKRVYGYRQAVLEGAGCKELMQEMIDAQIRRAVDRYLDPNWGPSSFAAWASTRLGLELEPRSFYRRDFRQAEEIARDESRRQAESHIIDVVEENLPTEGDPRDWNWESLTAFAGRRYGLKLKASELKKLPREKVGSLLYEAAEQHVAGVSLADGADFFSPEFGRVSLAAWTNQKFALNVKSDDFAEDDPADIVQKLMATTREEYRRRELEFPVKSALAHFMPEPTPGSTPHYDREGLLAWAAYRFAKTYDIEAFRPMQRGQVMNALLADSKIFFKVDELHPEIDRKIAQYFPGKAPVAADSLAPLSQWSQETFGLPLNLEQPLLDRVEIRRQLIQACETKFRPEIRQIERALLLQFLDVSWKDHLYNMDQLRSGIGLVGYAQIDPKVEYKRRGRQLFNEMWEGFEDKTTNFIFRIEEEVEPQQLNSVWNVTSATHEEYAQEAEAVTADAAPDVGGGIRRQQAEAVDKNQAEEKTGTIRNERLKIGRNDPCWCGSGKKYKNCHMKSDERGRGVKVRK